MSEPQTTAVEINGHPCRIWRKGSGPKLGFLAGLGMQDGALVLLCSQLGIGAEGALALALVKRFREVAIGLPGLIAGSVIQTRRWRRAA